MNKLNQRTADVVIAEMTGLIYGVIGEPLRELERHGAIDGADYAAQMVARAVARQLSVLLRDGQGVMMDLAQPHFFHLIEFALERALAPGADYFRIEVAGKFVRDNLDNLTGPQLRAILERVTSPPRHGSEAEWQKLAGDIAQELAKRSGVAVEPQEEAEAVSIPRSEFGALLYSALVSAYQTTAAPHIKPGFATAVVARHIDKLTDGQLESLAGIVPSATTNALVVKLVDAELARRTALTGKRQ